MTSASSRPTEEKILLLFYCWIAVETCQKRRKEWETRIRFCRLRHLFRVRAHMSSRRQMFLPWACTYLSSLEGERTVWSRNRSKSFWSPVVLGQWTKLKWKENFRMSQTTFRRLCEDLRSYIQKNDINCRNAIAVEHRVAIARWRLNGCGWIFGYTAEKQRTWPHLP